MTTIFGYHSESTSPARMRIDEAGRAYGERHRPRKAPEAQTEAKAIPEPLQAPLTLRQSVKLIAQEVAFKYGTDVHALIGHSKRRKLSHARWEAWWRTQDELKFSLARIGRFYQRDHSTICHGLKQHRRINGMEGDNGFTELPDYPNPAIDTDGTTDRETLIAGRSPNWQDRIRWNIAARIDREKSYRENDSQYLIGYILAMNEIRDLLTEPEV